MNLILYYLFVYLIEAIILWLYCNWIFTSRKNTFLSLLITIGMFSLLIPVAILTNAALNAFCSFIVYLCCIVLNYDSKPVWALFHALALTILMALSEGLIAAAIPDITIYAFRDGNIHSSAFTFVILSKSVYLCISQLVTRIFSKDTVNNASIRKSTLMLYLIPVMSSIITVSLGYICLNGKLSGSDSVIVFICLVLLLSINILTFYLQQDISQLNDGKHIDEITGYINNILGSDALRKSKRYCKIDILNVIISRYAEQCSNSGISFEADIRANTLEYLPAQDFTSIFCNLLDNAIDASISCDEPYIDCNVSLIRGGNADLISIANSCKSSPLGHDGKLHSRKQDTGFHGYGLKSVKRIADKYNGLLNYVYSEEKQEFRVVVMLEHP